MKYAILFLALYMFFRSLGRRRGDTTDLPSGTHRQSPPAELQEPDGEEVAYWEDDEPLQGPWSTEAKHQPVEDVPLSGPWSRPAPAGPAGDFPSRDTKDQQQDSYVAADTYPSSTGELPLPKQPVKQRTEKAPTPLTQHTPVTHRATDTGQEQTTRTSAQRRPAGGSGPDPFTAILQQKSTLAASIILGEVLASRGGRRKKNRYPY